MIGTPHLRVALTLVKAAALGVLLALVVAGALRATGAPAGSRPTEQTALLAPASGPDQQRLERALTSGACSTAGYGGTVVPGSALVRTPAGQLRVVGFDAGWAVLEGRRPGQLVAVCRADRAATSAVLRR